MAAEVPCPYRTYTRRCRFGCEWRRPGTVDLITEVEVSERPAFQGPTKGIHALSSTRNNSVRGMGGPEPGSPVPFSMPALRFESLVGPADVAETGLDALAAFAAFTCVFSSRKRN